MTADGFVWGTATAAYQIEGAHDRDGRTPSVWDTFSHTKGRTHNGDTGDVACGHYDRLDADLDLLNWLGVDAYRFSVSWTRILPDGTGPVNQRGMDFYNRLIDGLLARGIAPFLTIHHWDLPQCLQDRGGWRNRESVEWFVEFTQVLADNFGDRVHDWITINEPHIISWLGHFHGWLAPGITDLQHAVDVSHHLLLAHGHATRLLHQLDANHRVGISLGLTPVEPLTDSAADCAAAKLQDGFDSRWFLDPLYGRGYPQYVIDAIGAAPPVQADDLDIIASPTDFLGVNYYLQSTVRHNPDNRWGIEGVDLPDIKQTAMGWEIHPQAFEKLLVDLHDTYAMPAIYVTENGSAWHDVVEVDGSVHDTDRIEYLQQHVDAMKRAISKGSPVAGYFAWSLMDNFEWAFGYEKRFGLFYVDYATLTRSPKDSAHYYRRMCS